MASGGRATGIAAFCLSGQRRRAGRGCRGGGRRGRGHKTCSVALMPMNCVESGYSVIGPGRVAVHFVWKAGSWVSVRGLYKTVYSLVSDAIATMRTQFSMHGFLKYIYMHPLLKSHLHHLGPLQSSYQPQQATSTKVCVSLQFSLHRIAVIGCLRRRSTNHRPRRNHIPHRGQ